MLSRVVSITVGFAAFTSVLLSNAAPAAAVQYDLTGGFTGQLLTQFAGGDDDVFHTVLNPGSKFVTDAFGNGVLTVNATGVIKDTAQANSATVGTIDLSFSYFWGNLDQVLLNAAGAVSPAGEEYILSLTPDGQGNGAGIIGNIAINTNNLNDSATFNLSAKEFRSSPGYDPVNQYLASINQGTYLILGDLFNAANGAGIDNGATVDFKSWFMSSLFDLSLGYCRTGNYIFVGDLHARATPSGGTEVPEPASMALLGMGLLGGVFARRRRAQ